MASKSKWGPDVGKRAVFKDQHGHTYSAPVVLNDGQWVMVTSEGFAPITQFFDDDFAGRLEFVEYRDEPDERLHVEQGGDSFRALQASGAQAVADYRANRNRERRQLQEALNQPDARKIAEARANATALAQKWNQKRPEPIPPPILSKENIGALAEEARWRKRKIEPQE